MVRLVDPELHRPRDEEADPHKCQDEEETQCLSHRQPLCCGRLRGNPGLRRSCSGSLDQPEAGSREPDEQAEDGDGPETRRYQRVRRGIGAFLRRGAGSKRRSIDVLRILNGGVADESFDVRGGEVVERVPPRAPLQWLRLRQAVAAFRLLPRSVAYIRRPPDMHEDRLRTALRLRQVVAAFCLLPRCIVYVRRPPEMHEDRLRAAHHLQRGVRRGGDRQAEEPDDEQTMRRDVHAERHRTLSNRASDVRGASRTSGTSAIAVKS